MPTKQIDYNDEATLRRLLVGRRITQTILGPGPGRTGIGAGTIQFVLDSGTVLEVEEADGGCACSNGCWSVENPETTNQVITNVEVNDEAESPDYYESATLRMFVYADQIKTELVRSHGEDNGYYGWGYTVLIHDIEAAA